MKTCKNTYLDHFSSIGKLSFPHHIAAVIQIPLYERKEVKQKFVWPSEESNDSIR